MAIGAAQRKRRELVEAQPETRHSAKIIAALPKAAAAYRQQIERGLDNNPREANKARVILKELLGPIQMCPGPDGSLWAEFYASPEGRMAFPASRVSWSRRLDLLHRRFKSATQCK